MQFLTAEFELSSSEARRDVAYDGIAVAQPPALAAVVAGAAVLLAFGYEVPRVRRRILRKRGKSNPQTDRAMGAY